MIVLVGTTAGVMLLAFWLVAVGVTVSPWLTFPSLVIVTTTEDMGDGLSDTDTCMPSSLGDNLPFFETGPESTGSCFSSVDETGSKATTAFSAACESNSGNSALVRSFADVRFVLLSDLVGTAVLGFSPLRLLGGLLPDLALFV